MNGDAFHEAVARLDACGGAAEAPRAATTSTPVDLGAVYDALRMVIDPEVGLDIVTMGLIYELSEDDGVVTVTYTLTTLGCPMSGPITNGIVAVVSAIEGVKDVVPNLVFEPRWDPSFIGANAW